MTYFGQINKTVKATSTADAYVEVLTGDAAADNVKKNTAANSTEKYETNETFEDDAYVLYTFSVKEDEIQSVELAKSVAGTVTKVENDKKVDASKNKNVTINGETYKASATMANEILDKVSPKNDYTLYLDSYGYGIFVEEEEYVSTDFALLKDYRDKNQINCYETGTAPTPTVLCWFWLMAPRRSLTPLRTTRRLVPIIWISAPS